MNVLDHLPPYSVRESKRAKRVTLIVSPEGGLKVVIPSGFNRKYIPQIIHEKKDWIHKAIKNLRERYADDLTVRFPDLIDLKAVGRQFTLQLTSRNAALLELRQFGSSRLELTGDVNDTDGWRALLQRWLQQQGRLHLIPWLERLSAQTGLTFHKVQIRGQKSRWGSCSSKKTISLNYKLLFLEPELVSYILIHELCHTIQPNHSASFWALVAKLEPEYRILDARINDAPKDVPLWAK